MKTAGTITICLIALACAAWTHAATPSTTFLLEKQTLTVTSDGMAAWKGSPATFSVLSAVPGTTMVGSLRSEPNRAGRAVFHRTLKRDSGPEQCLVTDEILQEEGAIRWTVRIQGKGDAWAPEVESTIQFPVQSSPVYWTTWPMPYPSEKWDVNWDREQPLQFAPMQDRSLVYGGDDHVKPDAFSIPCAVVGEQDGAGAMMILHDIGEPIIRMLMNVRKDGRVGFARSQREVSSKAPVTYSLRFKECVLDWRPALGWVRELYPEYVSPKQSNSWMIVGQGAYTEYEGPLNVKDLQEVFFKFNWKVGYDHLYMGMYLPRTDDLDWQWTNARHFGAEFPTTFPTSLRRLADYSARMRASGFHVLNYMNPAEVGLKIHDFRNPPAQVAKSHAELWKDPNDFVFHEMREAVLFPKGADRPYGAWEDGVLMDIGVPSFQNHLVDQAKRHLQFLPRSSGVCFDRTDFLRLNNFKRPDGFAFVDQARCGSLALSWIAYMKRVGPLFRDEEKVVLCNPLYRRVDLYADMDGFYDEIGNGANSQNICAVLAFDRPYVAWTQWIPEGEAGDAYFQKYLYLGAFMTAPFPYNNHTIKPSERYSQLYRDYGLLFQSLRFRRWNTEPNSLRTWGTKGNLFEIPGGLLVVLTDGRAASATEVQLTSKNPVLSQPHYVEVIYPGANEWRPLEVPGLLEGQKVQVPLQRGCALVRIVHTVVSPEAEAFVRGTEIRVRTAVPDVQTVFRARVPHAGDAFGSWSDWRPLTGSLAVTENTWLQIEVRDKTGTPLPNSRFEKEWVASPIAMPEFLPRDGYVEGDLEIAIRPPIGFDDVVIRYTLDGTEPTLQSPVYNEKVKLVKPGTVRAKAYCAGLESETASATFVQTPPLPPDPDVFLSDLTALSETVGVPDTQVQRDLAWSKAPIMVKGVKYAKGIGTAANSDVVFAVKDEYRRFVAVVGVDDAMKDFPAASIVFRVYADVQAAEQAVEAIAGSEKMLFESPVMRPNQRLAVDVEIPPGTKKLRISAIDFGDNNWGDHADWANAGFLLQK